jgi:hypothetical protein
MNTTTKPMPHGMDYQGHYPQAAEACSEFCDHDNTPPMNCSDVITALGCVIGSWAVVYLIYIAARSLL